ncbi:hypothetical protein LQE92_14175 [Lacrimispora sp. NSJ-141]|uniref:Uncharacterized protein n=1 Tax=Lientehia hominis TaxID=2897778 RepID=A0AAP2W9V0_9FIRM|nr:hypothetical protein [Lientehia hominis]MCD2493751.1 hypothetical protein [Lientehia hominis]
MSIITGVIKTLTSKFGVTLPVTVTKAVYDEATGERLDETLDKRQMQSFISPEHLGLVRSTCTLVDLFNALPYFGTLSYWIGSNSAQIQSEIASQIGRDAADVFGTLSVTKMENLTGIYTFCKYGETPNLTYTASYDLVNATATWKNFVRNATADDVEGLRDLSLTDKGNVTSTLMGTVPKGFYQYEANTAGAPSTDAGVILSLPIGSAYAMRIAITAANQMYISVYTAGISYGSWKQIS